VAKHHRLSTDDDDSPGREWTRYWIRPDRDREKSPRAKPPADRIHTPPNSTPWWRRTWVIAAAAFVVVGAGIAGAVASGGSSKTAGALGDGRYLVGSQIQPGTYHTDGEPVPSKECEGGVDATCGCSYTRLSNLSGNPRAIIASDLFIASPITIEVERTDKALQLFGGCEWTKIG